MPSLNHVSESNNLDSNVKATKFTRSLFFIKSNGIASFWMKVLVQFFVRLSLITDYCSSTLHQRSILFHCQSCICSEGNCSLVFVRYTGKLYNLMLVLIYQLQNRVGELYSLVRFIGVSPYSSYYCKKCPCKTSTWKFSDRKTCDECGHKPMQCVDSIVFRWIALLLFGYLMLRVVPVCNVCRHFCWWNKVIMKPIQKYGPAGEGKKAFERLSILLDQIMLRYDDQNCSVKILFSFP